MKLINIFSTIFGPTSRHRGYMRVSICIGYACEHMYWIQSNIISFNNPKGSNGWIIGVG